MFLLHILLSLLKYVNKFDKKEEKQKRILKKKLKEIKSSEENNTKPVYEAQNKSWWWRYKSAIMVATIEMAETIGHTILKLEEKEFLGGNCDKII